MNENKWLSWLVLFLSGSLFSARNVNQRCSFPLQYLSFIAHGMLFYPGDFVCLSSTTHQACVFRVFKALYACEGKTWFRFLALFYDSECLHPQLLLGILLEKLVILFRGMLMFSFPPSGWYFSRIPIKRLKTPRKWSIRRSYVEVCSGCKEHLIFIIEVKTTFICLSWKVFSYGFFALNFWLTSLDI